MLKGKSSSSGMLRSVAFVITDFSEEHLASIIRVTTIGVVGIMLTENSSQSTLRRNTRATRRNIPEGGILHSHRRENLRSYIIKLNVLHSV
jgi:hypothetical protein